MSSEVLAWAESSDLVVVSSTPPPPKKVSIPMCLCVKMCLSWVVSVANMASYAISSSMILVIHDNMINGTNHIV
jgi:hypothetical protein